jgi:photosystem II stability/assembly factor-like uncharacterized protein
MLSNDHFSFVIKRVFFSLLPLTIFVVSSLAQFQVELEKTKRELEVRNIYTIIETNDSNIFAGTWGAGIWKSTDLGITWNRTSEGLLSYDIRKQVVLDNNKIFVATASGLYYTNNAGLNWTIINQLDQKVGYRNIIMNDNNIYVATDDGKIYKSSNSGETWLQTGKIDEPIITVPIIISQNKMLVGTENGLIVSEDEGRTWIKNNNEINNETIKDISLINETIYITTLSKGLFISTDDGNSVSKFDNGLQMKRVKFVNADARGAIIATLNGETPYSLNKSTNVWQQGYSNISASSIEFISSNRDGKMAAITSGGEVLISNDAGKSWRVGSQLICAIPNTRFVELKSAEVKASEIESPEERIKSYIPPPAEFFQKRLSKTNDATINVTYTGFSPEAQEAFQYAVDIWASIISSPVVINISASFSPLGTSVSGSAGPSTVYSGFNNQPIPNTFYPISLAEKINGDRINLNSNPDIIATFNINFSNWYFGTDGHPSINQYDFVSVVLHELCHGLGYVNGFDYSGGTGSWLNDGYPYIFDRFIYNGSGQDLLGFPHPSTELGSQLVSNNVFWGGASKPKMYAPTTYSSGSSISHLDYSTYINTDDRLMVHAIPNGVATHWPGIAIGQMIDIGWGIVSPTPVITISSSPLAFGNVTVGSLVTQNIIVTNNGTANLNISAISTSGTGFSCTDGNTNYPITLIPTQTCTLAVKYSPSSSGIHTGSITLTHNAIGSLTTIHLSGTGVVAIVPGMTMTMTTRNTIVNFILGCTGNATVDWGDGTTNTLFGNLADCSHNYSSSSTHTITIIGSNVTYLNCNNQLISLDVSNNSALTNLSCSGNQITSLDVSNNSALTVLSCDDNQLTSLDLSKNSALRYLICGANRLTSLDVSKNSALTQLDCGGNQLKSLDVSNSSALTQLNCYSNQLTSLDVSNSSALEYLNCGGNQLTSAELDALFGTLNSTAIWKFIDISNNPGTNSCNRSIATSRGWTVRTTVITAPAITIDPTVLAFGDVTVSSSSEQTIRITNSGTADLVISSFDISGGGFSFSSNQSSRTIMAGNYYDIPVKFSPTSATGYIGTVTITHNADGSPTNIYLTGNGITSISVDELEDISDTYSLSQNYPNPFNPITKIKYMIKESGFVSLQVFDVFGREIRQLVNEYQPSGKYEIEFNADNLPSGIYFYKLQSNKFRAIKKMMLIK